MWRWLLIGVRNVICMPPAAVTCSCAPGVHALLAPWCCRFRCVCVFPPSQLTPFFASLLWFSMQFVPFSSCCCTCVSGPSSEGSLHAMRVLWGACVWQAVAACRILLVNTQSLLDLLHMHVSPAWSPTGGSALTCGQMPHLNEHRHTSPGRAACRFRRLCNALIMHARRMRKY